MNGKIDWSNVPKTCFKKYSFKIYLMKTNTESIIFPLKKEMATHSSVLAWRIPGMGEPGELPSTGSHGVRHDWSNLVAVAALWEDNFCWWLANSSLLLRQFLYTVFLNLDPWTSPIPSPVPRRACPGINIAQLSRCLHDSWPSKKDVSLNIKLFWNKHEYKFE